MGANALFGSAVGLAYVIADGKSRYLLKKSATGRTWMVLERDEVLPEVGIVIAEFGKKAHAQLLWKHLRAT